MDRNSSDLISVIVPIYNGEDTIVRCVESILNQTYSNIEVIIIDDGSQDNTLTICKTRWKYNKKVRIYVQISNKGVSAARNVGLDHVRGKFVCFCDGDDYFEPYMLEKMHEIFVNENIDIVSCCIKGKEIKQSRTSLYIEGEDAFIEEIIQNGGFVWNKMFRQNLINGIRFDEELILREDCHFLFQIISCISNIKMIKLLVGLYNYSEGGITKGASNKHFKEGEFAHAVALSKIESLVPDRWKDVMRHRKFIAAIVERDSDYAQKRLSEDNRKILDQVIEVNKGGFLLDHKLALSDRMKYWLRYKFPWLKKYLKWRKWKVNN